MPHRLPVSFGGRALGAEGSWLSVMPRSTMGIPPLHIWQMRGGVDALVPWHNNGLSSFVRNM